MKRTLGLGLIAAVLALPLGCNLGGSGSLKVEFKNGSVSKSAARSVTIAPIADISASYTKFGTKLGTFTPTTFKFVLNALQLFNSRNYINFSPVWPQAWPTDEQVAAHYADFTNPYAPALKPDETANNPVQPGDYDILFFMFERGGDTATISSSGYTFSTDATITVDGRTFTTITDIMPYRYDLTLQQPMCATINFIYGPYSPGVITSENRLSELTLNTSCDVSTIQGSFVVSMPTPIHIDASSTITIEVVWDLQDIIAKYADDGPTPMNSGNPFYVLADGYWDKMAINVVVQDGGN